MSLKLINKVKSYIERLRLFKEVEREGTADDWATGFNIRFRDEFGTLWHMGAYKDPEHWHEQKVNRSQIVHTRNQIIKRLKRIL